MKFKLRFLTYLCLLLLGLCCGMFVLVDVDFLEVVGVQSLRYSDKSCSQDHEAYQALRDYHQEWYSYLFQHPDEIVKLETNQRDYIVRYQKPINENDFPLIYIQTYAPRNSTTTEGYGFAYFSGDKTENSAFGDQLFRRLPDNIFCYYPISADRN